MNDLLGRPTGVPLLVLSKAMSWKVLQKLSAAGFSNVFNFKVKL